MLSILFLENLLVSHSSALSLLDITNANFTFLFAVLCTCLFCRNSFMMKLHLERISSLAQVLCQFLLSLEFFLHYEQCHGISCCIFPCNMFYD